MDSEISLSKVVLLGDSDWPHRPGICCWRYAVTAAFDAAGAAVEQVGTQSVVPKQRSAAGAAPARPMRAAWLPALVRRPLTRGYRALTRTLQRPEKPDPQLAARLAGAALVVAESPGAAARARAHGVPRQRLWALVLPPDRMVVGDEADELTGAAARLAGILTDSEPARESIERATASLRPRVEIFPPLATDRPCPRCAGAEAALPPKLNSPVALLMLWRRLLDRPGEPLPYSSAAARFLGPGAAWKPRARQSWDGQEAAPAAAAVPEPWTAATQTRAARAVLGTVVPPPGPGPARRALLAGFDLKFAVELAERLDARPDLELTVDDWPVLEHGTPQMEARLDRAEAIFAEWVRPSTAWIAGRKRPDQFLATRLHRYELDYRYPRELDLDQVDAVVYIAPLFGRRIRDELGWPVEKLVYIPNFIDLAWLDRPKLPQARFAIGFVGIEWERKRFDLALDLLAALRREDPRYTLVVRSVMPWDNEYAWAQPSERAYASWCFSRIEEDPVLRSGVQFEPPGRDMARWYRRVGHVVSTSDAEGCHTAVAEGMASGAVPVVRPWAGADEVYDKEWVHASTESAVATILENADESRFTERAERAKAEINVTYDPAAVVAAWADLLHGDVAAARGHFAAYSSLPAVDRRTTGR
jgi:glycosyltransferase involved in cell wall biosynthesis